MKKVSTVFWISIILSDFFLWGVIFPEHLTKVMDTALSFFLVNFGWFYQLSAIFFLLFALFLIFSLNGKIKLGKDEDKRFFRYFTCAFK